MQDPSPEVKTRAIKILTGVAICEALLIDNGYSIEDRTLVCRVAAFVADEIERNGYQNIPKCTMRQAALEHVIMCMVADAR